MMFQPFHARAVIINRLSIALHNICPTGRTSVIPSNCNDVMWLLQVDAHSSTNEPTNLFEIEAIEQLIIRLSNL
jgi:hypothetical protein